MNLMVALMRAAGGVHFVIVAANAVLPRKLGVPRELRDLPPILRQIFIVHWAYIVLVLIIFGSLCLFFAPDLAGGSSLGRTLSACLALFWGLRVVLQLFYYDPAFMRRNALGHRFFTVCFAFLAIVFALAALGPLR